MNVTQSIQTNPAKALDLFAQISDSSDGSVKTRERLLTELKTEIEFYAQVEEAHLLAILRKHKETKSLASDAAAENRQVRKMLGEMEQMPKDSPEFLGQIKELRQTFQQHVSNERKELLPALKKALSDEQMQGLAHDMETGRADADRERREGTEQRRAAARQEREENDRRAEANQRQTEQDEREKQEAEQRRVAAKDKREQAQRQAEQNEREKQQQAEQRRLAAKEKRQQAQRQAEQDEREKQAQAEQRRMAAKEKREEAERQEEQARLREQREQAVAALRKSAEAANEAARQEVASAGEGLRRLQQSLPQAEAPDAAFGRLTEYGQLWMDFGSTTSESTVRATSAISRCGSPVQVAQAQLRYATEIGQAWMEAGTRMMEISLRLTMRR